MKSLKTNTSQSRNICLVTIGLPVFNGEEYISQAIESVLLQNFNNFQLIISDNSSSDATYQIAKSYADLDERIILFKQEKNIGPFKNFQYVLNKTNSKYFMWFAHDDVMLPDFLQECVNNLESSNKYDMAFTTFSNIDKYNNSLVRYINITKLSGVSNQKLIAKYLLSKEASGKANLFYSLYRTKLLAKCIKDLDFLFIEEAWGADMIFILGALVRGKGIKISNKNLFNKRITDNHIPFNKNNYFRNYVHKSFPIDFLHNYKNNILRVTRESKYFIITFIIIQIRCLFILGIYKYFQIQTNTHHAINHIKHNRNLFLNHIKHNKNLFLRDSKKIWTSLRIFLYDIRVVLRRYISICKRLIKNKIANFFRFK